jgi:hypothetical protein
MATKYSNRNTEELASLLMADAADGTIADQEMLAELHSRALNDPQALNLVGIVNHVLNGTASGQTGFQPTTAPAPGSFSTRLGSLGLGQPHPANHASFAPVSPTPSYGPPGGMNAAATGAMDHAYNSGTLNSTTPPAPAPATPPIDTPGLGEISNWNNSFNNKFNSDYNAAHPAVPNIPTPTPGTASDLGHYASQGNLGLGFQPQSYGQSATAFETGDPGGFADINGLNAFNTASGQLFDPSSDTGAGELTQLWSRGAGEQDAYANMLSPFVKGQEDLYGFLNPGQYNTGTQMANMVPGMIGDLTATGKEFNGPNVYDAIVGGDWAQTADGQYLSPQDQIKKLGSGLAAISAYYPGDQLNNLLARVGTVANDWQVRWNTDPNFRLKYPSLTAYMRDQGADQWM